MTVKFFQTSKGINDGLLNKPKKKLHQQLEIQTTSPQLGHLHQRKQQNNYQVLQKITKQLSRRINLNLQNYHQPKIN